MAAKDSPIVKRLAAQGVPWAVKLMEKDWRSLTKSQKQAARAAGVGPVIPTSVSPKVTRLVGGNPGNARRTSGDPGNAMKTMTITKQEFLGSIHADSLIHSLTLDPKNVRTFPHLSALAAGYNKYRFTTVRLRYSPRCSNSDCSFIAGFTTDSSDDTPSNKYQLYGLATRFECQSSKSLLMTPPIDKGLKFLRDCTTDDSKLVDCGKIYYMVDGNHDGILGELFLDFTVVLSEPQYSQVQTQKHEGSSSSGPGLTTFERRERNCVLQFQCAGKFLVSMRTAPIGDVRGLGADAAGMLQTKEGDHVHSLLEVTANEPMASLLFSFSSATVTSRIYVSRM
ncbi:p37 [Clematis chlorotic mottle virus]|uniref:Capsid protein n=1 Tax=Clematis chlorotic mottle virus TaxID=1950126 RepID=A0A1Q1MKB7_9TOMB|nr:p37 [Clematis chlorotic mottle virus]AQM36684.1 p37 [Clematis chlorotic mottle virus]AYI50031.1 coat protein [Clematis chlorotic mottle virus]